MGSCVPSLILALAVSGAFGGLTLADVPPALAVAAPDASPSTLRRGRGAGARAGPVPRLRPPRGRRSLPEQRVLAPLSSSAADGAAEGGCGCGGCGGGSTTVAVTIVEEEGYALEGAAEGGAAARATSANEVSVGCCFRG